MWKQINPCSALKEIAGCDRNGTGFEVKRTWSKPFTSYLNLNKACILSLSYRGKTILTDSLWESPWETCGLLYEMGSMVQSWRIIGRGEEWGTYHQGSAMSETDYWMVKQFSQKSVCVRDLAPAWIKAIIRDDKTGSKNKNKTNFDHLRKWMIMKPVQELSLDFSSGSISLASSMSHMERG